MPTIEANGQRFHVEDTGGDGPPIVFSHGFLMDHRMFAPQVEELAGVYRCISWDARGFGATEFDGESFTYWDSARDLFAILDALGIERAVLAGMSQGGYLSLRAALLAPDRVRALVLIDTQAPPEAPEKVAEYQQMIDTWVGMGYLEELATVVSGLIIGEPELEAEWREIWRGWDPSRMRAAGHALLQRDDITDRLEELAMPVLAVHGTEDVAIPVSRAHEICAAVDDCRGVVEVEGAAHAANLTHPQIVNPAIRTFLEGLPA
ncbi:MAG: alpha/beta hydrolase [Nitriliruptoraceae bacterium]|nr:alpha/beta hydrolase [Nitriliruptoraceae bacterium]